MMTDQTIQKIIGNVLKYGVRTVLVIAAIGGSIFLYDHSSETVNYTHFTENDHSIFHVTADVLKGVSGFDARSIIFLAILVLFCTPFIRLLLSLVSFILEKDRLYVFITTVVLIIICFSVYFGFGH